MTHSGPRQQGRTVLPPRLGSDVKPSCLPGAERSPGDRQLGGSLRGPALALARGGQRRRAQSSKSSANSRTAEAAACELRIFSLARSFSALRICSVASNRRRASPEGMSSCQYSLPPEPLNLSRAACFRIRAWRAKSALVVGRAGSPVGSENRMILDQSTEASASRGCDGGAPPPSRWPTRRSPTRWRRASAGQRGGAQPRRCPPSTSSGSSRAGREGATPARGEGKASTREGPEDRIDRRPRTGAGGRLDQPLEPLRTYSAGGSRRRGPL